MATKKNKPKKQTTKTKTPATIENKEVEAKIKSKKTTQTKKEAPTETVKKAESKIVKKTVKKSTKKVVKAKKAPAVKKVNKKEEVSTKKTTVENPVIAPTSDAPKIIAPAPVVEVKKPSLMEEVYGNEPIKQIAEFPKADFITQTKQLIDNFQIDCKRLPDPVVLILNEFIAIYAQFVSNPMQLALIPEINLKDENAKNALMSWIEPRKAQLERLKQGGVTVTNEISSDSNSGAESSTESRLPDGRIVANKDNINQVIENMPSAAAMLPPNQSGQQPIIMPAVFNPNPVQNVQGVDFLRQNPTNVIADNIYNGQVTQAVDKDFLRKYAQSISETVSNTFQMLHWGYIPLDVLQGILNNCGKEYAYEIINKGADSPNSYVKISDGSQTFESDKFKIA